MDIFDLEYQYQIYLKMVKLQESEMEEIQRVETKKAFMGACGQILILFKNELFFLKGDEGVNKMQQMIDQVLNYFRKQAGEQN